MNFSQLIEYLKQRKKEDLTLSFQQMIAVEKVIGWIEEWKGGEQYGE